MRRSLYSVFCITIGLILLAGCGSNSNSTERTDWESTIYETANNLEEVTMTIKESWHQVPIAFDDNYGFNDIGYHLAAEFIID